MVLVPLTKNKYWRELNFSILFQIKKLDGRELSVLVDLVSPTPLYSGFTERNEFQGKFGEVSQENYKEKNDNWNDKFSDMNNNFLMRSKYPV